MASIPLAPVAGYQTCSENANYMFRQYLLGKLSHCIKYTSQEAPKPEHSPILGNAGTLSHVTQAAFVTCAY